MAQLTSGLHTHGGMHSANKKVLVLVLALLLGQLACHAHSVSECCRQPSPRSCRLYVLLCGPGGKTPGGPLASDAAAGILTLGKRTEEEERLQSRLHRLLQGSRNQAAGILTMGRREEGGGPEAYGGGWGVRGPVGTPLPL